MKTLLYHGFGIKGYRSSDAVSGLTSGTMEGINWKIRGLLASAFGFRDQDLLKLRLYALREAKLKFVG